MKNGEKIGIVGAVITIIGSILPWFTLGELVKYGVEGDGIFTIAFGIIAAVLIFLSSWDAKSKVGTMILGILTALIGFYYITDPFVGIGLYVTILGGAVLVVSGIVGFATDSSSS